MVTVLPASATPADGTAIGADQYRWRARRRGIHNHAERTGHPAYAVGVCCRGGKRVVTFAERAGWVKFQRPLSAVVLPMSTPLLYRLMMALACAVPLRAGRVSLVVLPAATRPVIVPTSSNTLAITGAGGTPVNGASTLPAVPMLPAASCALTSSVCPLICGGLQREGEITGGVGCCGTKYGSAAGGDDYRTVCFGNAGQRGAVGVDRQTGWEYPVRRYRPQLQRQTIARWYYLRCLLL